MTKLSITDLRVFISVNISKQICLTFQMSKLCAPVRDDEIAELRKIREVVPLFQGIMKTMENMKLDMANFMVQQVELSKHNQLEMSL